MAPGRFFSVWKSLCAAVIPKFAQNFHQVIDGIHRREACYSPDRAVSEQYKAVAKRFNYLAEVLSEFGDYCGV